MTEKGIRVTSNSTDAESLANGAISRYIFLRALSQLRGSGNFPITPQLSAQPTQIQRDLTTKDQAVNIRKNIQEISTNFRPWTSFGAEFVVSVFLALHRS